MNKLLLVALLLTSKFSLAQNSILAGKITDENNKPIPDARIQVTHGKIVSDARSDADGIYYTQLLPEGYYRVDVYTDGRWYKGRKVFLEDAVFGRKYYDLRVINDRVNISVDDGDPFVARHLQRVREQQMYLDAPPRRHTSIIEQQGHFFKSVKDTSNSKGENKK